MNSYKITFTRENGTEGYDHFTAATEKQARKDFSEVYRHGNGTIKSIELVRTDATATKQQERDTLEKIKAMVEQLGPDSYLRTAFEGCFEDAETNIENDFAFSMKSRWESAEEKAEHYKEAANHFSAEADKAQSEIETLKAALAAAEARNLTADDLTDCIYAIENAADERRRNMNAAAAAIVEAATDPESDAFKQAVKDHRNAKEATEYYEALAHRLNAARAAGAQ